MSVCRSGPTYPTGERWTRLPLAQNSGEEVGTSPIGLHEDKKRVDARQENGLTSSLLLVLAGGRFNERRDVLLHLVAACCTQPHTARLETGSSARLSDARTIIQAEQVRNEWMLVDFFISSAQKIVAELDKLFIYNNQRQAGQEIKFRNR